MIDETTARAFAHCALTVLETPYPHAMQHLTLHGRDRPLPHSIHPVFHGSYDWHSSVHMHWSLVRLLALYPAIDARPQIEALFRRRFTAAKLEKERAYFKQFQGFERPYGWAWYLTLWQALAHADNPVLRAAAPRLAPLAADICQAWRSFLKLSHYPQRAGTHGNSAFAMLLALRAARSSGDGETERAIARAAVRWFGQDTRYPAQYEPGGNDFLSAGLCEALLMSEVLGDEHNKGDNFAQWWKTFRPTSLDAWLAPVRVGSRSDPQLVHLDGLNLSRAWCLRLLAKRLPREQEAFRTAARKHLRNALPHVTGGDFVATHWLVSFALLAVGDGSQ